MSNAGRRWRLGSLALAVVILAGAAALFRARNSAPSESSPRAHGRDPALLSATGAEEREAAAIEGRVLDPDGRGVGSATVVALRQEGDDRRRADGVPLVVRSSATGAFRIAVPPGVYAVAASSPGLTGTVRAAVRVTPGQTTAGVDLRLGRGGATLSGRVLDAGGGTIPGARVRAVLLPERTAAASEVQVHAFEAEADSEGRYRLELPRARYTVIARFDGYASRRSYVVLDMDETRDFALQPAARLAGRVVTGDERRPVPGATVSLQPAAATNESERVEPVTSDEEGRFQIATVPAGSHWLIARKGALVGTSAHALAVTAATAVDDIEIVVAPGLRLEGTITNHAGQPIARATVVVRAPRQTEHARSDQAGRFTIDGLRPAEYWVEISAEGHLRLAEDLPVAASLARTFVLDEALTVRGVVLTAAGAPAAGAQIEASVRGPGVAYEETTADGEGRFVLRRLGPGELILRANLGGDAARIGPEPLARGQRRELTVRLSSGATASGVVVWDDGAPAVGIRVEGGNRDGARAISTRTDTGGLFTLGPFWPGEVSISALPPGEPEGRSSRKRPQQADLTLSAGEKKEGVKLTIARRDAAIRGSVVGPGGQPVDGAIVRAAHEQGGPTVEASALSGIDGTFALERLARGPYTLRVAHPAHPKTERSGVEAGTSNLRLQLQGAATLAGVVVDTAGKPVHSCSVLAVPDGRPGDTDAVRLRRATSGDSSQRVFVRGGTGAFRIDRLSPGTYELLATTSEGGVARSGPITVAEGESRQGLRLVVRTGAIVTGRVIEYESGQPLAKVRVVIRLPWGELPSGPVHAVTDAAGAFALPNTPALPGLFAEIEAPGRTHIQATIPLGAPKEGRIDLGTLKLLRLDPDKPNKGRVGLMFHDSDGQVVVGDVVPDLPGAHAGIKKGDVLLEVDGQPVGGDVGQAMAPFHGDPGREVRIKVQTPGQPPREVKLRRAL